MLQLMFGFTLSAKTTVLDGWLTCDFASFSTVFQSYQDDERLIMKGCVQWNPILLFWNIGHDFLNKKYNIYPTL